MSRKKVEEKKEELVTCEACGKKHLASLDVCPKCGYSVLDNKKTFYDEDDEDIEEAYDEEYDDEDEEEVVEKVTKKSKKEIVLDEEEVEEEKPLPKKEEKKEKLSSKEEKKKEIKNIKKKIGKSNNKKEKYYVDKAPVSEQGEELMTFIKIIICIILLVVIFYLIYSFASGEMKKDDKAKEKEEVVQTIQNERILASSIFDKADSEYFVLIYDTSDEWADYYTMVYEEYILIEDEDVLPIFIVELDNKFNEDIIAKKGEETNPSAQKYSELKVSNPTLIRIKDGKNAKYYEGDKVVDKLSREIKKFNDQ